MKITAFATNEKAELSGVWKDVGPGASLLIARDNNTAYVNMMRKEMEPYSLSMESLPEKEAEKIVIKVMAHTILLDWKGLQDDDEQLVVYSVDTAIEWLTKYKEFKKLVLSISHSIDNYRNEVVKEVQEQLKKP